MDRDSDNAAWGTSELYRLVEPQTRDRFQTGDVWNGAYGKWYPFDPQVAKDGSLLIIPDYLGVVPAFCLGIRAALAQAQPQDIICCLHDDVEIQEQDWDLKILEHFDSHPGTVLAGFFGATGLGADDIYQTPYDPMQLARRDCWSNVDDAEAHGQRSEVAKRAVCFDGFSQIMTVECAGYIVDELERSKLIHHGYDSAIGALAARYYNNDYEAWMIPVKCHHAGGQTAVGDPGYQAWAKAKIDKGDQGFWEQSHRYFYENLRDVLPLRLPEEK